MKTEDFSTIEEIQCSSPLEIGRQAGQVGRVELFEKGQIGDGADATATASQTIQGTGLAPTQIGMGGQSLDRAPVDRESLYGRSIDEGLRLEDGQVFGIKALDLVQLLQPDKTAQLPAVAQDPRGSVGSDAPHLDQCH